MVNRIVIIVACICAMNSAMLWVYHGIPRFTGITVYYIIHFYAGISLIFAQINPFVYRYSTGTHFQIHCDLGGPIFSFLGGTTDSNQSERGKGMPGLHEEGYQNPCHIPYLPASNYQWIPLSYFPRIHTSKGFRCLGNEDSSSKERGKSFWWLETHVGKRWIVEVRLHMLTWKNGSVRFPSERSCSSLGSDAEVKSFVAGLHSPTLQSSEIVPRHYSTEFSHYH